MKISLALGQRRVLSRQTAWGCLTSNLAVPGTGSLVAGYRSGYVQLAMTLCAFSLTSIFGLRFIYWVIRNWARIYGPHGDSLEALLEIWPVLRWALVGIGLFGMTWLWALQTSLSVVREAKQADAAKAPPPLR
jgi:hypothetical protein